MVAPLPPEPVDGKQAQFTTPASAQMAKQRGRVVVTPSVPAGLLPLPPGRVRFRTKEGRRHALISLLIPHASQDSSQWDSLYRGYRRFINRQLKAGKVKKEDLAGQLMLVKRELDVVEETGKYFLRFRPVSGRHQATLETDNPVIIDYIRWRLSRGDFPYIYEEARDLEFNVGGRVVKLRATNLKDQQILVDFMRITGIGSGVLEFVEVPDGSDED